MQARQEREKGPEGKTPPRKDDSVNNDNVGNKNHDENSNEAKSLIKKARVVSECTHETSTIDTNQCCICFIHYQDDVAKANGQIGHLR